MKALLNKLRNDGHITDEQYKQLKTAVCESYAFNEAFKELMLKRDEHNKNYPIINRGIKESIRIINKWLKKSERRSACTDTEMEEKYSLYQ